MRGTHKTSYGNERALSPHQRLSTRGHRCGFAIQSPSFVSDILRADLTVFDMLLTWLWQRLAGIRFDLLQK